MHTHFYGFRGEKSSCLYTWKAALKQSPVFSRTLQADRAQHKSRVQRTTLVNGHTNKQKANWILFFLNPTPDIEVTRCLIINLCVTT